MVYSGEFIVFADGTVFVGGRVCEVIEFLDWRCEYFLYFC